MAHRGRVSASKRLDYQQIMNDVENRVREVVQADGQAAPPQKSSSPAASPWCRKPRSRCSKT